MSNPVHEKSLDVNQLRQAIQKEYEEVALKPEQGFHFHTGRPLAQMLGYAEEWLEGIPETAIESFAGTGNPFRLDEIESGNRVVDIGSGAGFDNLIAARMAGRRLQRCSPGIQRGRLWHAGNQFPRPQVSAR